MDLNKTAKSEVVSMACGYFTGLRVFQGSRPKLALAYSHTILAYCKYIDYTLHTGERLLHWRTALLAHQFGFRIVTSYHHLPLILQYENFGICCILKPWPNGDENEKMEHIVN